MLLVCFLMVLRVTTSSLAILPLDPALDYWQAVTDLSPNAT